MVYAGFWKRLFAVLLDTLFLLILWGLTSYAISNFGSSHAVTADRLGGIFTNVLYVAYQIYFHARWGQTLGKMAVKIKVVRLDLNPIGASESLKRSSIDLGFVVLGSLCVVFILAKLGGFSGTPITDESVDGALASLVGYRFLDFLMIVWVLAEPIVILFNEKKRAIHDFIAGTVVVRIDSEIR